MISPLVLFVFFVCPCCSLPKLRKVLVRTRPSRSPGAVLTPSGPQIRPETASKRRTPKVKKPKHDDE